MKGFFLICLICLASACGQRSAGNEAAGENFSAYLFTYFTGNGPGEEAIHYAISNDGFNFRALNKNQPVIAADSISRRGGVRDPHLLRGEDGKTFYMVVTDLFVSKDGWNNNQGMVLLKSNDLINWTHSIIHIPDVFPEEFGEVNRVWAPQTIYDPQKEKYMIYWSMRFGEEPDKIYYAYANDDFTGIETAPKQLFFSPDNGACIDGDIIFKDGKYHLFFKTEGNGAGIKKAVSDKLTEGYVQADNYVDQTDEPVEGSSIFKLNDSDTWILMYDVYTKGKYQFTRSNDLENFTVIDEEISMNFHPRHGTILPITAGEAERLAAKWLDYDDIVLSAQSDKVKKINIALDSTKKRLHLPVKTDVNLSSLDPEFTRLPGVIITPQSAQDFSAGPVKYTIEINGKGSKTYEVEASEAHNPVLEGYYADPDILFAEKTGKFYIYPTSDGFTNWSGTYFKTFSSDNLVDWKDEGIILDLKKDVSWADRNAWAPCIIEKKVNGQYKYFYYFTAAQKIGVAVADEPTGPFVDSGKPLIDQFPKGVTGGQQIDPDVFSDPKTGKNYLYWGNGYMAGAELNDDMISIKPGTVRVLTPDTTYREGTHVLYRNGTYYFMWSEDDTRSENYRVRYGTSDSPLGKINVPKNNLVIAKDKEAGIYATGHHSTIQMPEKDEWYIVYHRFNYPNGINMGRAAGYNREVCIDKMEFEADGSIRRITPTFKGVSSVKRPLK